jgi:hypothetical protein
MAFDTSPTNDKVIFITAIGTVAILFGLVPFFDSYWDSMRTAELGTKIEGRENAELERYRTEQARLLSGGPMSIAQASAQLAQRGRSSSPAIAPRVSERPDVEAVEGWVLMKNEAAARHARSAFERAEQARLEREAAAAAAAATPAEPGATAPAPTTPGTPVP